VIQSSVFGNVLHRQIAGALAKRIVNYAKIGDNVTQSTDSGFIKFGSRVDIFLPLGTKIKVKLHQKVVGGITVVAQK
jgi:phosphatidylserine decarboxylase